ncbi:hypothetical protein Ciccas_008846 [Cichlidogyrus casuarinus]|uniref:Carboxylesterase type B domain-containing protein n=1 Tax=Cichlidogyrus casuarinus TaxID=1844966 RepID=A0ABD2PYY7_9PLAT
MSEYAFRLNKVSPQLSEECFKVFCGYVCPKVTKNWASIYGLPYASLVLPDIPLSPSIVAHNLIHCTYSFSSMVDFERVWFSGGFQVFKADQNITKLSCPGDRSKKKMVVNACLSIDIHYKLDNFLRPVLIYVAGQDFTEQNSKLISVEMANALNVIVINVRVRTGVFGFGYLDSGSTKPNNAITDLENALTFIREQILEKIHANSDKLTLFAEGSAVPLVAVLYTKTQQVSSEKRGFHQLWLQNGGINVPERESKESDFLQSIRADPIIYKDFLTWISKSEQTTEFKYLSIDQKIENWMKTELTTERLFEFLPPAWTRALAKESFSSPVFAKKDGQSSCLLCTLADQAQSKLFSDVPFLIYQNLDSGSIDQLELVDLYSQSTFESLVKQTLSTLKEMDPVIDFDRELLRIYEGQTTVSGDPKILYKQVLLNMINDVRRNCPQLWFAKFLIYRRHVVKNSVYLLFDTAKSRQLQELQSNTRCQMPWFLSSTSNECQVKNNEGKGAELFLKILKEFMHTGSVVSLERMQYPEPDKFVNIYNHSTSSFVKGNKRVEAMLEMCKIWASEEKLNNEILTKFSSYF